MPLNKKVMHINRGEKNTGHFIIFCLRHESGRPNKTCGTKNLNKKVTEILTDAGKKILSAKNKNKQTEAGNTGIH